MSPDGDGPPLYTHMSPPPPLYTHMSLHVPQGDDAGSRLTPVLSTEAVDDVVCRSLWNDGYAVLKSAVPMERVDAARAYVAKESKKWIGGRRRPDDWRMHYRQRFDEPLRDGHGVILDLVSPLLSTVHGLTRARPVGVFYTQLAYRTPTTKRIRLTAYHIDGEANACGARFPDSFSLIIAVALSSQMQSGMGNFTVFPGAHRRDWSDYPHLKRHRQLPDLGPPLEVLLDPGDAVLVHPLLPHRGGSNSSETIRELAFFRIQVDGVLYDSSLRAESLLQDPFAELPRLLELVPS